MPTPGILGAVCPMFNPGVIMSDLIVSTPTDTEGNSIVPVRHGAKGEVQCTIEAALVGNAAFAKRYISEVPAASAFVKATHGNFRAAVEIVSLGASAVILKNVAPHAGKPWTKGRLLLLCELVLDREPPAKGWPAKAQAARALARKLQEHFNGGVAE